MSILIDDLIRRSTGVEAQIGDYWYKPKPFGMSGLPGLVLRIKDAWRVVLDKSRAYHYKEDEVD